MSNSTKNRPLGDPKMTNFFFEGTPIKTIGLYVFEVVEHESGHAEAIRGICHGEKSLFLQKTQKSAENR